MKPYERVTISIHYTFSLATAGTDTSRSSINLRAASLNSEMSSASCVSSPVMYNETNFNHHIKGIN